MEGDTLIDSDSGSFDSMTFLPKDQPLTSDGRIPRKRSFDKITVPSSPPTSLTDAGSAATTTTTSSSSSSSSSTSTSPPPPSLTSDGEDGKKNKKKRRVSFRIEENEAKPAAAEEEKRLSPEEIEEMKRKTEHWWNLPADTTQEDFDVSLLDFKDGLYFRCHMEMEWVDVLIQRACARLLARDQSSEPVQSLVESLHTALTHGDADQLEKLAQGDEELLRLTTQFKALSADVQNARQALTDRFGIIHSAKIAIKSEVYVCAATRLKVAGMEVTDASVQDEIDAFERGESTVPGSQVQQGGCLMAQNFRGPAPSDSICPVSRPHSEARPSTGVCPFSGFAAPTDGGEARSDNQTDEGVCPYSGNKAPSASPDKPPADSPH